MAMYMPPPTPMVEISFHIFQKNAWRINATNRVNNANWCFIIKKRICSSLPKILHGVAIEISVSGWTRHLLSNKHHKAGRYHTLNRNTIFNKSKCVCKFKNESIKDLLLNFVWWEGPICRRPFPFTTYQYCGWTNNRKLMHSGPIMCWHCNNLYSLSMTAIPIYIDTPAFAYHIRIFLMHPGPFHILQAPKTTSHMS